MALAAAVGVSAPAPALAGEGADAAPARKPRGELVTLVRQDCGSCHGLTLKGGLGLPLTPEALQGKPREGLVITVARGRPGTAMPPWAPLLHEKDIEWIVDQLISGFPER